MVALSCPISPVSPQILQLQSAREESEAQRQAADALQADFNTLQGDFESLMEQAGAIERDRDELISHVEQLQGELESARAAAEGEVAVELARYRVGLFLLLVCVIV